MMRQPPCLHQVPLTQLVHRGPQNLIARLEPRGTDVRFDVRLGRSQRQVHIVWSACKYTMLVIAPRYGLNPDRPTDYPLEMTDGIGLCSPHERLRAR